MKNFKNQKGTITLFVLISMLFFIILLITAFVAITNSEITQAGARKRIKELYEQNVGNENQIYTELEKKYIQRADIGDKIPIYKLDEFKQIGSGNIVIIDDIEYTFLPEARYILMNDIEIGSDIGGSWIPIWERYEGGYTTTNGYIPLTGSFDTNEKNITVKGNSKWGKAADATDINKTTQFAFSKGNNYNYANAEAKFISDLETIANKLGEIRTNEDPYIGTLLEEGTKVTINGIVYINGWYKIDASTLNSSFGLNLDTNQYSSGFIAKYTIGIDTSYVALISIDGMMINGVPIYYINYSGQDGLYAIGLLTGATNESERTTTKWGQTTIRDGVVPTYDANYGLLLGSQMAEYPIDQSKPVDETYSINVTVKGSLNQDKETYGVTIVAISDANSQYLAWIRIRSGYLQVLSYTTNNRSGLTGNTKGEGYMSKEVPLGYENNYMNIQVVSKRGGLTRVYLNGVLFETFTSGSAILPKSTINIGDLRNARNLKYTGAIYNMALYAGVIDENVPGIINTDPILHNWNFTKTQLGIL